MSDVWDKDPEKMFSDGFDDWYKRVEEAVYQLALRYAAEIEAWMKANARWQDQTGNLRQSLFADVERFIEQIVIAFDYGLDYGFWLEFANQGFYAIITPALDQFGPRWVADLQRLLS